MHLKVGELARSSGLTVRTLHHYDAIGLLCPSARSDAGYRLYDDRDVARLHAIQALRHLGLSLADIGPLLDTPHASPQAILEQQIRSLEHQVRQATDLRDRLVLLRDELLRGKAPAMGDWVQSLSLMATFGKYFSAGELKSILGNWATIEQDWLALQPQVRAAMERGLAPDTPEVQALAWRWMRLMHRWMDGDFDRLDRWGAMYQAERGAHGLLGAPPTDILAFMERAVTVRAGLLRAHFGEDGMRRIRVVADARLQAIEQAGRKLLAAGTPPGSRPARALLARWRALMDEAAGGDPALRAKLMTQQEAHPLLLAGSVVSAEVRAWLLRAHRTLDPHAT